METFVLAIGRQWSLPRLRAEVCKTSIAGPIPAVASEAKEFAYLRVIGGKGLKTLVVRLATLRPQSKGSKQGSVDEGKGLQGKGLRLGALVRPRESSDCTARPDVAAGSRPDVVPERRRGGQRL